MGIDVARVNERLSSEEVLLDSKQLVSRMAFEHWASMKDTVCLRFIDPYGDTLFNQAQIPFLLGELQLFSRGISDPEIRGHLHSVEILVASAIDQVHTYVRFIGD